MKACWRRISPCRAVRMPQHPRCVRAVAPSLSNVVSPNVNRNQLLTRYPTVRSIPRIPHVRHPVRGKTVRVADSRVIRFVSFRSVSCESVVCWIGWRKLARRPSDVLVFFVCLLRSHLCYILSKRPARIVCQKFANGARWKMCVSVENTCSNDCFGNRKSRIMISFDTRQRQTQNTRWFENSDAVRWTIWINIHKSDSWHVGTSWYIAWYRGTPKSRTTTETATSWNASAGRAINLRPGEHKNNKLRTRNEAAQQKQQQQ